MILETITPVVHLDVEKMAVGGSREGIVTMKIGSRNLVITERKDGNSVSVEVIYGLFDDKGAKLPTFDNGRFLAFDTPENPNLVRDFSEGVSSEVKSSKNLIDVYNSNVLAFAKIKLAEIYNIDSSLVKEVVN